MKKRMKEEAISRMKKLGLHENVVNEFIDENKLNMSEGEGFLYWLREEDKERVKDWEHNSDSLAYHAIYNNTNMGEMLSILYVSSFEDDWEYERYATNSNCPPARVINLTDEYMSDTGGINIKRVNGGLKRVFE